MIINIMVPQRRRSDTNQSRGSHHTGLPFNVMDVILDRLTNSNDCPMARLGELCIGGGTSHAVTATSAQ